MMLVVLAGLGFWLVAAVTHGRRCRRTHRRMDGFMTWNLVAGALLMAWAMLLLGGAVWIRSVLAGAWILAAVGLIVASRTIGRAS
jgi:hypothetical protein